MNIVETKNLNYQYEDGSVGIKNLDISIQLGKFTALLGENGAGKSTFFLNLNGVLKPNSGDVYFSGEKVVYDKKGIRALRQNIGIVFQDPNDQLFSSNVRGDISFGALNMGKTQEETAILVEEVARQTGVIDFIDKPTHALSFGQKKRVAIAGILIMNPKLIILDEPTAGLDPSGVSEILHLLMKIRKETGVSVIISTHDIDIVPLYCDYAIVLNKGQKVLEGTPAEIFSKPEVIRQYGLRMPRIAHLMSILSKQDGIKVDTTASTIAKARASIKEAFDGR